MLKLLNTKSIFYTKHKPIVSIKYRQSVKISRFYGKCSSYSDEEIRQLFKQSGGHIKSHQDLASHGGDLFDGDVAEFSVRSYSGEGFVVDSEYIPGSIILYNDSVFSWKVTSPKEINIESLMPLWIKDPTPSIIVIGTGDTMYWLENEITESIRKKGISLEVLSTPNAIATFNFLKLEGRPTAGAFLAINDARIALGDDAKFAPYPQALRDKLKQMDQNENLEK